MKKLLLLICMLSLTTSIAKASEPKLLDVYKDWESYTFNEKSGKVCYMTSAPKTSEGKYSYRGDIRVMLTHRPGDASKNVFSFTAGYNFKAESEVTLSIGKKSWKLFTDKDTAWAKDEKTDDQIAKALQKGSKMIIRGTSSRGTKTKDTFSLKGTMAAYKAVSDKCGIKQ